MLYFARWKTALILVVLLAGVVLTIPNFFPKEQVDKWPSWLPRQQIVLGLDLQGGAYLLYEVDRADYVEKRLRTLVSDIRKALTTAPRIGYTGLGMQGETVQVRIRELEKLADVRKRLEPLRNLLASSLLGGGGVYEFDLNVADDGLVRFSYSNAGMAQRVRGIVSQSIEVINRRINELGTTEPSIQRQGDDRILVEAPGLGDPARLKAIVGQTAQLTFHLVVGSFAASNPQTPQPGTIAIPSKDGTGVTYLVQDTPLMTGEDLV
ncbi:MAG TPA: protein translocase subunit SecD, partial [Bauldia sp.]|nr:protein translocase subunit SecD [Bauldia sp.]